MKRVELLDCTLRDGGYVNEFRFGEKGIKTILRKLAQAGVDIIECGFLTRGDFDPDKTLFTAIDQINPYISPKRRQSMYVAMLAVADGPFDVAEMVERSDETIDGVRISFHSEMAEMAEAFRLAAALKDKGYQVFIQPIDTASFSDKCLRWLISETNRLEPYAIYMVDTLGCMRTAEMMEWTRYFDSALKKEIGLGLHSHNNLQLSFANAMIFLEQKVDRRLLLDASVFGMGRGAGNLCTELVADQINTHLGASYEVVPLLEIVDESLAPIMAKTPWGYSVPYYLAAMHQCHPSYVTYLLNRQTITVKSIDALLKKIPASSKNIFCEKTIKELYLENQHDDVDDRQCIKVLTEQLAGKKVLVLAPGKSLDREAKKIIDYISKEQPIVMAVNFVPESIEADYVFFSNKKRFRMASEKESIHEAKLNLIITSNIIRVAKKGIKVVHYTKLLNREKGIEDNAGLMAINLLKRLGVAKVSLAGFDGFSENKLDHFFEDAFIADLEMERLRELNHGVGAKIADIGKEIPITFLTKSAYYQKSR